MINYYFFRYGFKLLVHSNKIKTTFLERENVIFFKPIWSDCWETLFSKLNTQSEVNGGTVPKNAVHQMFLYLRVMLVSIDKAIQGSNKMADQFNISPARR